MSKTLKTGMVLWVLSYTCLGAKEVISDDNELLLADAIVSVVHGPEGANVITQSDLLKPGIDGQMRTIEELEREYQMFQDACRLKIADPNDEESIDSYLRQIQTSNKLSDEDLEQIFKQSGRTVEEGRKELQRMHAVSQIVNFKVHRNLLISPAEVEAYCGEHPERTPAQFTFRIAYIGKDECDAKLIKTNAVTTLEKLPIECDWSKELVLVEEELAEHLQFIKELKGGQVSIKSHGNGYIAGHVLVSIPETEISVKQRYPEVEALLKEQKFPVLLEQYQAELDQLFVVTRLTS